MNDPWWQHQICHRTHQAYWRSLLQCNAIQWKIPWPSIKEQNLKWYPCISYKICYKPACLCSSEGFSFQDLLCKESLLDERFQVAFCAHLLQLKLGPLDWNPAMNWHTLWLCCCPDPQVHQREPKSWQLRLQTSWDCHPWAQGCLYPPAQYSCMSAGKTPLQSKQSIIPPAESSKLQTL